MSGSDHALVAREIIKQLLAAGPLKGAHLKVRLVREFERRTGANFDAAFWNHPKFSSFLFANRDIVDVLFPSGPGDVTVVLTGHREAHFEVRQADDGASFFLPASLWTAFTNPDPKRRRFFHRVTHQVVHYLEGSELDPNPRISGEVRSDQNYVEITPATADQQSQWMREFVSSISIPQDKKPIITSLLAVPYTSQLNTTFVTALGELGETWSQQRAHHVRQHVEQWARETGVGLEHLFAKPTALAMRSMPAPAAPSSVDDTLADLRRALHAAIDAMSAAELAHVLLPATALPRIAKDGSR